MKKRLSKIIIVITLTALLISSFALSCFAVNEIDDAPSDGKIGEYFYKYPVYDLAVLTYHVDDESYSMLYPSLMNYYNDTEFNPYYYQDPYGFDEGAMFICNNTTPKDDLALTATFRDIVIHLTEEEIAAGANLRTYYTELPYFDFYGLHQSFEYDIYESGRVYRYELTYSIYSEQGALRDSGTLENSCYVYDYIPRTADSLCKFRFTPFYDVLERTDDPSELVVIDSCRIYPVGPYDYFGTEAINTLTLNIPTVSDPSEINGVSELSSFMGQSDPELQAKLEAREKELASLRKENFELQNSNAIDELFTGLSGSVWEGFATVADLGYSYVDPSGTTREVTVGNLIAVAVVGVVAFFVIRLIRGS